MIKYFNDDEIDYLFRMGLFQDLAKKFEIFVDLFEEEIVCEKDKLLGILNITEVYYADRKADFFSYVFVSLIDALKAAISKETCLYFIL